MKLWRKNRDGALRGNGIVNRISRLRHFRGRGIHSPYIYSIIRNVFIDSSPSSNRSSKLYNQLVELGTERYVACEIARLALHCGFEQFSIDEDSGCELIICSPQCPSSTIEELSAAAQHHHKALILLSPLSRLKLSNHIVAQNSSAVIERYHYMILLNNHLPKQLFRL